MIKVKSNGIVRNLTEDKDLCNPNLLTNADFKSGIINQRAQDSYSGQSGKDTYTIDRWRISQNTSTILTVQDGYVSVIIPNNEWVGQYIEYKPDGAMSVAVKLKDTDIKVFSLANYVENGNILKYDFGELETNVFVILSKHSSHEYWQLYIMNTTGDTKTLNIEYIKLEKGSVYTGMPVWNEVEETSKCIPYFEVRTIVGIGMLGNFSQFFGTQQAQYYLATGGFAEKARVPTVEVKEIHSNSGVASGINVNLVQGVTTNELFSFALNTNYTRPYLNFKCFINAEIY